MTPQIAIVGFRELDNPDAWRVEVVVDGVVSGHIYRGGAAYRYYEGPRNDVTWSSAGIDLARTEAPIGGTSVLEMAPDSPAAGQPGCGCRRRASPRARPRLRLTRP